MSWLWSILIAVALAGGGAVFGGFLANRATRWLMVSQREGYAAYWMIFMALLAGLYGLVAGLLTLRYAGFENGFYAFLAAAAVVFGGIGLLWLLVWLSRDRPPHTGGKSLGFDVEIRTSAGGAPIPQESIEFYAYLSAEKAPMEAVRLQFERLAQVEGRWLLPGFVQLHSRRPRPYIALGGQRLAGATVYFRLPEASLDQRQFGQWSAWLDGTPSGTTEPVKEACGIELRVRPRQT